MLQKYAKTLLGGIYDKELLSSDNLTKIKAMVNARELELWELDPEIPGLLLFHPDYDTVNSKRYAKLSANALESCQQEYL